MSDPATPGVHILFTPSGQPAGPPPIRRAPAACTVCRARKIRCNAKADKPCSNCLFENVQCVLITNKYRAKKTRASSKATPAKIPRGTHDAQPRPQPQHQPRRAKSPLSTTNTVRSVNPIPQPADGERQVTDADDAIDWREAADEIDWREAAFQSVPTPLSPAPSDSPVFDGSLTTSEKPSTSMTVPPSFLRPIPPHLTAEDVQYLYRKGALSVPDAELRDALIDSYTLYVHPCYPMLDFDALEETRCGSSNHQFSLLVFQAVMFTGLCWVDIKLLRRLGFLTRKAARKEFYQRVKLLYDADYELDPMCQLQALLLLSTWWKPPGAQKDAWHWFGIALSLAQTLGLQRDANSQSMSPKARALRRRTWWVCVIRDTFVSLSQNRVPRIRESDFGVAPLTLDDLENQGNPLTNYNGNEFDTIRARRQLPTICIQLASICQAITSVLHAAYHETSTGTIDILYFNANPLSGISHMEPHKLKDLEDAFRIWSENAPAQCLHATPTPLPFAKHEQAAVVHRALLSMLYHTGLLMLHRQKSPPADQQGHAEGDRPEWRAVVRDAASEVNKIIMDIYTADLMKDMHATVVSCLFPVSVSHLLDMRSRDPVLRREGRRRLQECKQALREMTDGHVAAEWAVNFLTYVEARVNTLTASPTCRQASWSFDAEKMSMTESEPYSRPPHEQPRISDVDTSSTSDLRDDSASKPSRLASTEHIITQPTMFNEAHLLEAFSNPVSFTDQCFGLLDAQFNSPNMSCFDDDMSKSWAGGGF